MGKKFLFGTYRNYNSELHSSPDTQDRFDAKWRSQFEVDENGTINDSVEVDDFFFITQDEVFLCHISDTDYLLRKTGDLADDTKIKRYDSGGFRYNSNYIGKSPEIKFAYTQPVNNESAVNPNQDPFPAPVQFARPLEPTEFIDFAEVKLELGYDYGVVGGPEFRTEVIEVADGREQRNALRQLPLGRWQLGQRNLLESEADKIAEITYLRDFQKDRLGAKQGFRFKDWADCRGTNQLIAIGDGQKNQFQLRKAYQVGSAITYRPIQKPVADTVILYVDGEVVDDDWDIDYINGVVSHADPLPDGAELRADFEFDVPVWFESDQLPMSSEFVQKDGNEVLLYKLGSVFVVEGRIPLILPWDITPNQEITEDLNLGIVYDTVEKTEFSTQKIALKNGYSKRQEKREESRILFDFGNRKFLQAELDTLISYFWNFRGKAGEFPFVDKDNNYKVRFNSDKLNIKFEAANPADALFLVSGLKLQLKEQIRFRLPPNAFPLETLTINPQDPNDPATASSGNSSTGYGGGGSGSGGGGGNQGGFGINAFSTGLSFDFIPPGETSPNVQYQARLLFWAAGTLHLLISSSSFNSIYRNRLIYYRLRLINSWHFEYQDLNIWDYVVSSTDVSNPKIFSTPTGVSVFLRANNERPLGTDSSINSNGILRFEIKNDGTQSLSFVKYDDLESDVFNNAIVNNIYGSNVYLSTSNINQPNFLGSFDGLNYYKNNEAISRQAEQIITRSNALEDDNQFRVYFGTESILSYYPRSSSFRPYLYPVYSSNGHILTRVVARQLCPNNDFGCDDYVGRVFFLLQENSLSPPELIDIQNYIVSSTGGDSYYVQTATNIANKIIDRFGNMLVAAGLKLIYYRAGSGYGINILPQLGIPGNHIRSVHADTPYGFCLISHSKGIFQENTDVKLFFVQNSDN